MADPVYLEPGISYDPQASANPEAGQQFTAGQAAVSSFDSALETGGSSDVAQLAQRYSDQFRLGVGLDNGSNIITGDEANKRFGIQGPTPETSLKWDAGEPVDAAQAATIAAIKHDQIQNQLVQAGRPQGWSSWGAATAGEALGNAVDPTNLAFLVLPESAFGRGAELLAKLSGSEAAAAQAARLSQALSDTVIGRTANAGINNAAAVALMQPIIQAGAEQDHMDYGWAQAGQNILFGGLLGAGLHVAGEAFSGLAGATWRATMRSGIDSLDSGDMAGAKNLDLANADRSTVVNDLTEQNGVAPTEPEIAQEMQSRQAEIYDKAEQGRYESPLPEEEPVDAEKLPPDEIADAAAKGDYETANPALKAHVDELEKDPDLNLTPEEKEQVNEPTDNFAKLKSVAQDFTNCVAGEAGFGNDETAQEAEPTPATEAEPVTQPKSETALSAPEPDNASEPTGIATTDTPVLTSAKKRNSGISYLSFDAAHSDPGKALENLVEKHGGSLTKYDAGMISTGNGEARYRVDFLGREGGTPEERQAAFHDELTGSQSDYHVATKLQQSLPLRERLSGPVNGPDKQVSADEPAEPLTDSQIEQERKGIETQVVNQNPALSDMRSQMMDAKDAAGRSTTDSGPKRAEKATQRYYNAVDPLIQKAYTKAGKDYPALTPNELFNRARNAEAHALKRSRASEALNAATPPVGDSLEGNYGAWMDRSGNVIPVKTEGGHASYAVSHLEERDDLDPAEEAAYVKANGSSSAADKILRGRGYARVVNADEIHSASDEALTPSQASKLRSIGQTMGKTVNHEIGERPSRVLYDSQETARTSTPEGSSESDQNTADVKSIIESTVKDMGVKGIDVVYDHEADAPAQARSDSIGKIFVNPDHVAEALSRLPVNARKTYLQRMVAEEVYHNAQFAVEKDWRANGTHAENVSKIYNEISPADRERTLSSYGDDRIDPEKATSDADREKRQSLFIKEHTRQLIQRKMDGETTEDTWLNGDKPHLVRYIQAVYNKLKAYLATSNNSETAKYVKAMEGVLRDARKQGHEVSGLPEDSEENVSPPNRS